MRKLINEGYNILWLLWERLLGRLWVEVVVPRVCPKNEYFIGCLIPFEDMTMLSEALSVGGKLNRRGYETTLVTRPLGRKNRHCISLVLRYDRNLSPSDQEEESEKIAEWARTSFRLPTLTVYYTTVREAEGRLL